MGHDSVVFRVAEIGEGETGGEALGGGFHGFEVVDALEFLLVHLQQVVVDVVLDRVVFLVLLQFASWNHFFFLGERERVMLCFALDELFHVDELQIYFHVSFSYFLGFSSGPTFRVRFC